MGRGNRLLGILGERLALEFLRRRNYKIMGSNYRTPFGEIDAVAKKDGFVVFIEIKTRLTSSLGPPYLSVTGLKKRRIVKNALVYLKRHGLVDSSWRVDVVSVKIGPEHETEAIEIIENAVEDDY